MPTTISVLFLIVLGSNIANFPAAQDMTNKPKQNSSWMFRETATLATHSDQVCFSTCKYKGDSGTYLGMSDKDDDSCSTACGKASKACKDANDTNCTYVDGSCKYTNCS